MIDLLAECMLEIDWITGWATGGVKDLARSWERGFDGSLGEMLCERLRHLLLLQLGN